MRTTGKQCGLAATGDYQPSLRSPWLVAGVAACRYTLADVVCSSFCSLSYSGKLAGLRKAACAASIMLN
ncbi:hypothetical protein [Thiolapillus sp.]|uniref:hypothetical protein n=1 Tax=Thiolapillus sp. TaxID=2017437 RepID=UPI0025FBB7B9|nr:hypothetical protein [Thiolapillus sp.]